MNYFKKLVKGLHLSLRRFPVSLGFSTISTIILIILVNLNMNSNWMNGDITDILGRIAMILAMGFPLSLSIKLIFERMDLSTSQKIIIRTVSIALLLFYYFYLLQDLNMVSTTRYIAISLTLYLLFLVVPYFYRRDNFVLYVVKIFSRLITTILYAVVLYAGLSLIIFTMNRLLNVPVNSEFYLSTWLVVIGIFAPIFLLAGVPAIQKNISSSEYPHIFEILILYIIMPLITVYTSILYLYFIKILISRQWPEGLVSHLVLWYAALCIIIIFFISPFKKSRWVELFTRWLPRIILPLLLMMFTAIGIRIHTYGVTENRYFVVALGLWAVFIMIYLILSKKRRNIILPLSLALIALFSVIGPWSCYSLAVKSQNNRFKSIISKYDMIENIQLHKVQTTINDEDEKEIKSILRYFYNNHQLSDLKYLPYDFNLSETEEYFGFAYTANRFYDNNYEYFSHDLSALEGNDYGFDVRDYDYLYSINNCSDINDKMDNNISIKIDNKYTGLLIKHNDNEIYQKDLLPLIIELHNQYIKFEGNDKSSNQVINPKDYTYVDENRNIKLKIFFQYITGTVNSSDPEDIEISNLRLYILLKLKENY